MLVFRAQRRRRLRLRGIHSRISLAMASDGVMDLWPSFPLPSMSDDESHSTLSGTEAVDAGIDVSALFSAVQLPQSQPMGTCGLKTSPNREASNDAPKSLSHAAMLHGALKISGVRVNLPRRRRSAGKQAFDRLVLDQLATDPSAVRRQKTLSRREQKDGFHEFRRWYIALSGLAWRDGEHQALKLWSAYTNDQRFHWVLIRKAVQSCGFADLQKAPPSKLRRASDPEAPVQDESPAKAGVKAEETFVLAVDLS